MKIIQLQVKTRESNSGQKNSATGFGDGQKAPHCHQSRCHLCFVTLLSCQSKLCVCAHACTHPQTPSGTKESTTLIILSPGFSGPLPCRKVFGGPELFTESTPLSSWGAQRPPTCTGSHHARRVCRMGPVEVFLFVCFLPFSFLLPS